MHIEAARKIGFNLIEKPQKLLMPVSPVARANGHPRSHIHGRKQRCDALAFIVVRLPRGHARRKRQNRLRPIQRLYLALLIDTEHDRAIRRIEIQPHDIPHLLHELGILREFEVLHPMRLQPESTPNPHDGILRQTHLFSHQPRAPVRAPLWHGLQSLGNDLLNLKVGDFTCAPPRGSSSKPSIPNSRNRSRHFPTVAPVMCKFRATSELLIPSPQLSTIRARIAIACDDFGRRAIMLNFSRSASTISSGFLGRPVRMPKYEAITRFMQRICRSGH